MDMITRILLALGFIVALALGFFLFATFGVVAVAVIGILLLISKIRGNRGGTENPYFRIFTMRPDHNQPNASFRQEVQENVIDVDYEDVTEKRH